MGPAIRDELIGDDDIKKIGGALVIGGIFALGVFAYVWMSPGQGNIRISTPAPLATPDRSKARKDIQQFQPGEDDSGEAPNSGEETNRNVRARGLFNWGGKQETQEKGAKREESEKP